jgi:hypothetical protein
MTQPSLCQVKTPGHPTGICMLRLWHGPGKDWEKTVDPLIKYLFLIFTADPPMDFRSTLISFLWLPGKIMQVLSEDTSLSLLEPSF